MSVDNSFWIVVDISSRWDGEISEINKRTCIHKSLLSAQEECDELTRSFPQGSFVIFKSVEWRQLMDENTQIIGL